MKTFVATIATILLLAAFCGIVTAQEMEQEKEEQPMQMPMMQGMMGRGMMGQMPMMQGMMGGQGRMMGQMGSGMMCPMCGQMMQGGMMGSMMQGMMGGQAGMMQGGMMGQMPMMQMMMGGGMMGQMHRMPTPQMLLFLADELELEEEQVKSIQKMGFALQKEVIQKNADRAIAELELSALLSQDEIDLEQAQKKIQQIATSEGELRIAQIKASIEAKEVLTDEQRSKIKELMIKKAAMHIPQKAVMQKEKRVEKKSMH